MATYAIGDLQGCFDTFQDLLARVSFDPTVDRLWLAGDLVNRGPKSLEVLRWVRAHEHAVHCVLGNHELYLLARHAGRVGPRRGDTVQPILDADDGPELIEWVRRQPLLHHQGGFLMVHAGLLPGWTVKEAIRRARAVEGALRDPAREALLADVRKPGSAAPALAEMQRDLAVFTRIRMINRKRGEPDYAYKGSPEDAPASLVPWYRPPHRRGSTTVLFGHWAALGLRIRQDRVALDSGCVWGNRLSAYRLEDGRAFQVRAKEPPGED